MSKSSKSEDPHNPTFAQLGHLLYAMLLSTLSTLKFQNRYLCFSDPGQHEALFFHLNVVIVHHCQQGFYDYLSTFFWYPPL